jgi:putative flippase GtrA
MMQFVNLFTFWVKDEKKREHLNHFLGFAIVGVFMTLMTLAFNFMFLNMLHISLVITYIVVAIITIFISYLLNTYLVFKQKFSIITLLLYYGVYLSGMIVGIPLLKFFEYILPVNFFSMQLQPYRKFLISAMPIPITLIWNYIFTSIVMKNKRLAKMLKPDL